MIRVFEPVDLNMLGHVITTHLLSVAMTVPRSLNDQRGNAHMAQEVHPRDILRLPDWVKRVRETDEPRRLELLRNARSHARAQRQATEDQSVARMA